MASNNGSKPGILRRISAAVDKGMTKSFYNLGGVVGRRPWTVIIVTGIVGILLMFGFARLEVQEDAASL